MISDRPILTDAVEQHREFLQNRMDALNKKASIGGLTKAELNELKHSAMQLNAIMDVEGEIVDRMEAPIPEGFERRKFRVSGTRKVYTALEVTDSRAGTREGGNVINVAADNKIGTFSEVPYKMRLSVLVRKATGPVPTQLKERTTMYDIMYSWDDEGEMHKIPKFFAMRLDDWHEWVANGPHTIIGTATVPKEGDLDDDMSPLIYLAGIGSTRLAYPSFEMGNAFGQEVMKLDRKHATHAQTEFLRLWDRQRILFEKDGAPYGFLEELKDERKVLTWAYQITEDSRPELIYTRWEPVSEITPEAQLASDIVEEYNYQYGDLQREQAKRDVMRGAFSKYQAGARVEYDSTGCKIISISSPSHQVRVKPYHGRKRPTSKMRAFGILATSPNYIKQGDEYHEMNVGGKPWQITSITYSEATFNTCSKCDYEAYISEFHVYSQKFHWDGSIDEEVAMCPQCGHKWHIHHPAPTQPEPDISETVTSQAVAMPMSAADYEARGMYAIAEAMRKAGMK